MVRYLADLLGGLPGFRPTDNRTEALTKSGYASALGGSNTVRGKTNLLDPDPTFYDDTGAYGGETVADLRMGGSALGGVGQPYRTPVRPDYLEQAQRMTSLDTARLAPVTPGPPAHGTTGWMPPGERGAAGAPAPPGRTPAAAPGMAQGQAGPQPGGQYGGAPSAAGPPSGAPPPPRPNFLPAKAGGGFGDWLSAPIMNQERGSGGTSRLMAIGQLLSGVGAGMAQGGISGGIQGLNQSIAGLREGEQARLGDEEERQYRRLEMDLKRKALEQKVAPQPHVLGAGGMLVGPNGEVLARADTAKKAPTSIEAALLSDEPEIRARAEELRDRAAEIKGTPTPLQREQLELSRKRLEVEIAKANRPGGTGTPPAPSDIQKLIEYRNSLPPGSEEWKLADQYLRRKAASGGSGGSVEAPAPEGYLPLSTTARTAAEKELMALENSIGKFEAFGQSFDPSLQTARSSAAGTVAGLLEWAGVPLDEARQQQLESVTGQRAALGEIAGIIRNDLFGAGLTGPEMKSAESFIPKPGDSATQVKTKMTNLQRIAEEARFRKQELLDKGIKKRERAAATAAPPPAATSVAPAPQAAAPAPATQQQAEPPPLELNQSPREYARKLVKDYGLTEEQAAARARAEIARLQGEGG